MIANDIRPLLKQLGIEDLGRYEDEFYIIGLKDSDDYARMYSRLDKNAVNTEYPQFGVGKGGATEKATNYFEAEAEGISYDIFLIADFAEDRYLIKIKERPFRNDD